jgi:hypothetical protein
VNQFEKVILFVGLALIVHLQVKILNTKVAECSKDDYRLQKIYRKVKELIMIQRSEIVALIAIVRSALAVATEAQAKAEAAERGFGFEQAARLEAEAARNAVARPGSRKMPSWMRRSTFWSPRLPLLLPPPLRR